MILRTKQKNIKEILDWGVDFLKSANILDSESSVEVLASFLLGIDRSTLKIHLADPATKEFQIKFTKMVRRRSKHESVWHIIERVDFCDNVFFVNKNVLVPRPETEFLVEAAIKHIKQDKKVKEVLEIGTGSGAIVLSIAKKFPHLKYFASDISKRALKIAQKNADNLGLKDKINWSRGNLFSPWENEKFDLIVANLPYIPTKEKKNLPIDVLKYDPKIALFAGGDGLLIYKRFFEAVFQHLNSGGRVIAEIGYDQGRVLSKYIKQIEPRAEINVWRDYGKEDRLIFIKVV